MQSRMILKTFHLKIISNLQKSCCKNKNSTKHLYSFTVNSFTVNILFICIIAQEHPSTLPPNTNTKYIYTCTAVYVYVCVYITYIPNFFLNHLRVVMYHGPLFLRKFSCVFPKNIILFSITLGYQL